MESLFRATRQGGKPAHAAFRPKAGDSSGLGFCGQVRWGASRCRQWFVPAAQRSSGGLFGSSWTEGEELWDGRRQLTECEGSVFDFWGVPRPC